MTEDVGALVDRLARVERRLADHATRPLPPGFTDPDPATEERWDAGQVWAHLAEFPGYWLNHVRRVAAHPGPDPLPFGRVKTDAGRIEAIERDRHEPPAALLARVRASLAEVLGAIRSLPPEAWEARGLHPTLGEMTVRRLVERFIIAHLEEHADQLDGLAA